MTTTSSVLYDAPGPLARKRERVLSIVLGAALLALLVYAVMAMVRNNIFDDRWLVLVDPPREQTAGGVWYSLIVNGLIMGTLRAALLAIPLAGMLALILTVLRTAPYAPIRAVMIGVIELLRGLPVLIMILFGYVALELSSLQAVVFGLVLYNAAVLAEILRAGLASISKGQGEAGTAIGLTPWQNLRIITLPQAIRVMMPSIISQLVVLLKDSSLGFVIGYPELLRRFQLDTNFFGDRYRLPLFLAALGIFILVNFLLGRTAIWTERYLSRRGQRPEAPPTAVAIQLDPAGGTK